MIIRVLIFGPLAQQMGVRELAVEIESAANVRAVNEALARAHPDRAEFFRNARLAVNSVFASPGQMVMPDDEVAVIEMVSGG